MWNLYQHTYTLGWQVDSLALSQTNENNTCEFYAQILFSDGSFSDAVKVNMTFFTQASVTYEVEIGDQLLREPLQTILGSYECFDNVSFSSAYKKNIYLHCYHF